MRWCTIEGRKNQSKIQEPSIAAAESFATRFRQFASVAGKKPTDESGLLMLVKPELRPVAEKVTEEELLWALAIVNSRSFVAAVTLILSAIS